MSRAYIYDLELTFKDNVVVGGCVGLSVFPDGESVRDFFFLVAAFKDVVVGE